MEQGISCPWINYFESQLHGPLQQSPFAGIQFQPHRCLATSIANHSAVSAWMHGTPGGELMFLNACQSGALVDDRDSHKLSCRISAGTQARPVQINDTSRRDLVYSRTSSLLLHTCRTLVPTCCAHLCAYKCAVGVWRFETRLLVGEWTSRSHALGRSGLQTDELEAGWALNMGCNYVYPKNLPKVSLKPHQRFCRGGWTCVKHEAWQLIPTAHTSRSTTWSDTCQLSLGDPRGRLLSTITGGSAGTASFHDQSLSSVHLIFGSSTGGSTMHTFE